MTTQQYHIDGMSCAACSSAVERVTRKLNGVESSNVNLTTNRMVITYDESQVTPEMICEKVSKAGFSASLIVEEEQNKKKEEEEWQQQEEQLEAVKRRVVTAICCGAFALHFHGSYAALYPALAGVHADG